MNKAVNTPDSFLKFRDFILDADKIRDEEKRNRFLVGKGELIKESLESLQKKEDWIHFGILLKVLSSEALHSPVPFLEVFQSETLCAALEDNEAVIKGAVAEFNFERAEALKILAETGEHAEKYTDRHRFVEAAIKLVWEQCDSGDKWTHEKPAARDAYNFIAECYLVRARLALPKGSTIPEKKLEALAKAMRWAKEASGENDALKAEILLEIDRWDKNYQKSEVRKNLESFLKSETYILKLSDPLHWAVADRLCAFNEEIADHKIASALAEFDLVLLNDDQVVESTRELTKDQRFSLPLRQARAAYRSKPDEVSARLKNAVDQLGSDKRGYIPLSHHLWDDTVKLIKDIAGDKNRAGQWESAVISAWEKCREAEKRIKLSIQVRWWWSRYQDLFDLAFKAAYEGGKSELAAEIADSRKSRPTIKIQNLERSLKDEDLDSFKQYVEADALFATGGYQAGLHKLKSLKVDKEKDPLPLIALPADWAAIHFYITADQAAYAVIVEDGECNGVEIDIDEAWKAFGRWEAERRAHGVNKNSADALKKLCQKCGKMLAPVIDTVQKRKIVFIPYGFLHMAPLHASILKDDSYLFEKYTTMVLPYWGQASREAPESGREYDILQTHLDSGGENIQLLNQEDWSNKGGVNNTREDVLTCIKSSFDNSGKPPRLIALFCHGQGDLNNPYNSRFLMKDGPLTHQKLVQELPGLGGCRVMLSACESDLVSGSFDLLDEHLSLANAFLSKKSGEVLGSLFTCGADVAREIILEVKSNPGLPVCEILREKQEDWLKNGNALWDIAVFRVMGSPRAQTELED